MSWPEARWSGAVTAGGAAVYATVAEAPENAGDQPSWWQQVLWRCTATACHRQILDTFPATFTRETMAVATDGGSSSPAPTVSFC